MSIEAGTVVILKSGGSAMTVVSVEGDSAECVWCGEEGDFFRESIPTVALTVAIMAEDDEDKENEDDDSEDNEDTGKPAV